MIEEKLRVLELKLGKFHLGENDYLVLKFPEDTGDTQLHYFSDWVKERFPQLAPKVLIIGGDVKIYVAHVEDKTNEKEDSSLSL